jgi:hypothetical protein
MSNDKKKSGTKQGPAAQSRRHVGKRSKVVSISEWQNPGRRKSPDGEATDTITTRCLRLSVDEAPLMSVPQKKVALIYYILSGDITDQELDRMVGAVATPA